MTKKTIELRYPGYTGILGDVFDEILVKIKGNTVTVLSGGSEKTIPIIYKPITYTKKDCIFELKKTQLNVLKGDGIKLFTEAQDIKNVFFNMVRSLFISIITISQKTKI